LQRLYLGADHRVFRQLALQKPLGQRRSRSNPRWCQHVQVTQFVARGRKVFDLDQPFANQGLEAIINPAEADPKFMRDRALTVVGMRLEQPQQPELQVFAFFG
jgi:hypothetical protein